MANTFTPLIENAFVGDMVYNLSTMTVPDTIKKQIDTYVISYRPLHLAKHTGFDDFVYRIAPINSANAIIDLQIQFVGSMPIAYTDRLRRLAAGCAGAGVALLFRDDWVSNKIYTCRWSNAGDFVETSNNLSGAEMALESWEYSEI